MPIIMLHAFFDPDVDCILDIGGQDMKCIKIKNQTVDSVQLERSMLFRLWFFHRDLCQIFELLCSGFCHMKHLFAKNPIDLGTRCTVFMNSKVKQAQKEGA